MIYETETDENIQLLIAHMVEAANIDKFEFNKLFEETNDSDDNYDSDEIQSSDGNGEMHRSEDENNEINED